jgi:peroxiredoxin Q/BCP
MSLPVGSRAPDFELADQDGAMVQLSELTQEHVVVLYFYPKDETPGCTAEACAFRDAYDVFLEAGAQVVGVSADSVARHKRFAQHHGLGFVLLSDEDKKVRKLYDVKDTVPFLLPGRETYVIDTDRVIRHHFSAQIAATAHVEEALGVVRRLSDHVEP